MTWEQEMKIQSEIRAKEMAPKIAKEMAEEMAPKMAEEIGQKLGEEIGQKIGEEIAEKKTIETAKKMLKDNMPPETVSRYTSLSLEEVLTLQKEI